MREPPRGVVYGAHPDRSEDLLTIDDAIRELLDVSTDVRAVAVLDDAGAVVAAAPGPASEGAGEATEALWAAAARSAGGRLEHLVVPVPGGAVAALEAHDHRIVAVTGPRPAVALLLFDLRTCLGDAYSTLGGAS